MADVKLSALALIAAASISATDVFPMTDADPGTPVTYKTTAAQLRTSLLGAGVGSGWGASDYLGLGAGTVPTTGMIRVGQGAITSASPLINSTVTWNSGGTTFTHVLINVTDTASAAASLFVDYQIAGVSKLAFKKDGSITAAGGTAALQAVTCTTLGGTGALSGFTTGVFSSTVTASGFVGNASTATILQTARTINGVSFNGSANITVSAGTVGTLTFGTHLTASSASFAGSDATISSDATSANTVSTIVARDGSGNFSATTITANLTGNASGTAATVTSATQASITTCANLTTIGTLVAGAVPASLVTAGSFGAGAFVFAGAVSGITTFGLSGAITQGNTTGGVYVNQGATTATKYHQLGNSGTTLYYGIESSAGGAVFSGSTAYAGFFGTDAATPLQFWTNHALALTINGSTQAATFTAGVTCTTLAGTGAVSGFTTATFAGDVSISTTRGAASAGLTMGATGGTAGARHIIFGVGVGNYNWFLGAQENVNNAFEITPSTATGGATFTTPVFQITQAGAATIANGLTVSAGTTAVQALTATAIQGGAVASQFSSQVSARGVANNYEFGHSNTAGYGGAIGAISAGNSFLAFNASLGTNANTYKTWGIKGAVIQSDVAGGWVFGQVATASADNQSLTNAFTLSAAGAGVFTAGISATTGTFSDNTSVVATKKVGLNAGLTSYIYESGAGQVDIVTGSTLRLQINGTYVAPQVKLIVIASASGSAGLNLPAGSAPSAPADGDMWTTTTALLIRLNGVTKTVTLT